jgi:hypothetical protein
LLDAATAAVIDEYRTKHPCTPDERAHAEAFAKDLVRMVGAGDGNNARTLLGYLCELAIWCQRVGIPLTVREALRESTLQQYLLKGIARDTNAKKKAARAALRRVGRRAAADLYQPLGTSLPKSLPSEPYDEGHIAEYLRLAAAQPTDRLRRELTALICACRGGGIDPAGLRHLRGVDVRIHAGSVVCTVRAPKARQVPIDEPYGRVLLDIAGRNPGDYLVGGDAPTRKNVTSHLTERLHGGQHLPALTASRLRATWQLRKLERIGFYEFCKAAGIEQSAQVFSLLRFLPEPTLEREIEVLWEG